MVRGGRRKTERGREKKKEGEGEKQGGVVGVGGRDLLQVSTRNEKAVRSCVVDFSLPECLIFL